MNNKQFEIIVVGNVGRIEEIATKSSLTVMVYHGIGLKQTYYNDIVKRIDIRAVESKERFDILSSQGYNNLIINGYTKCDPLIIPENNTEDLLTNIGLDQNKKTILYAPTFYPSSIEKIYPELQHFSNEFNLIIKLHNFSWFQKRYKYQSEMMMDLDNNMSNVYLAKPSEIDVIPFMKISNLLISDISSTIFEFLYLNRPIIMAECFNLRLKHKIFNKRFIKKMDLSRMESIDFVLRLEDPNNLISLVYHSLEYPKDLEQERLVAQREYLFKLDGKASYRMVNAIESKLIGSNN